MRSSLLIYLLGFLAILPQVHGEKLRWDWRAGDVYDVTLKSNVDIHVTTAGQQLHYVNQFDVNGEWTVEEGTGDNKITKTYNGCILNTYCDLGTTPMKWFGDADTTFKCVEGKNSAASLAVSALAALAIVSQF